MNSLPVPAFTLHGEAHIDAETRQQMAQVMSLPVAVAGALMPDAHIGYGLPIGGVLATENSVIPYAVGVDIACRMCLSVFPTPPHILGQKPEQFKKALLTQTLFGAGKEYHRHERHDHAILDDPDWQATWLLRKLHTTAAAQLGTSGSGNHFVEWGALTVDEDEALPGLKAGAYLALLSHSGSRGVGFRIAQYYSELAQKIHPELEAAVERLAWLALDDDSGQEYWLSMQLAGRFAAACHEVIHRRLAQAIGFKPVVMIENHHNFAWREVIDGREVIVHRKGATPAGAGVIGIIPGSMGDAGYVVRGRGQAAALHSAAHGAGRRMSRKEALASITRTQRDQYLKAREITLMGGELDEAPQAYKPIAEVMAAQAHLVTVIGQFMPRMVRMDGR
ncbi:MAG: RtcB family protein [Anaerolineae bacterium]|nr:RtcB family protein [Anaerolineae bacterium]